MGLVGSEVWGSSPGTGALEEVCTSVRSCPAQYGSHGRGASVTRGMHLLILCKFN